MGESICSNNIILKTTTFIGWLNLGLVILSVIGCIYSVAAPSWISICGHMTADWKEIGLWYDNEVIPNGKKNIITNPFITNHC